MRGKGGQAWLVGVCGEGGACMVKGACMGDVLGKGGCVVKGGMRGKRGLCMVCTNPHPSTRYGRSMRGRYASYWNAFLFSICVVKIFISSEYSNLF